MSFQLLSAQDFEFNAYTTIKELRFFKDLQELGGGKTYSDCMSQQGGVESLKKKDFTKYNEVSECIMGKLDDQYNDKDLIDLFKNQYQIDYFVGQNKLKGNKQYLLRKNIEEMINRNLKTQDKNITDLSSISRVDELSIFKELAIKNRDLYFSEFCLLNQDSPKKSLGASHEEKIINAFKNLKGTEKSSLDECRKILSKDACGKKTSTSSMTSSKACRYKEIINNYSRAILKVEDSIKKLSSGSDDPRMVLSNLSNNLKIDHSKITEIDGKNDQISTLLEGGDKDQFSKLADELDKRCATGNLMSDDCQKLLKTGDAEQYNQLQLKISLEAARNIQFLKDAKSDEQIKKFVVENGYYTENEFNELKKTNPKQLSVIIEKYFENRRDSLAKDLSEKFSKRVTYENSTDIDNITTFLRNKKTTLSSLFQLNEATKEIRKSFKPPPPIDREKERSIGNSAPKVELDDFYIDIFNN